MKAIKKANGTIDLIGLSPREARVLTVLAGSSNGSYTDDIYEALSAYFDCRPLLPTIDLYSHRAKLDETPKSIGGPARSPNGRFLKKKWVARFQYVGEKDWSPENREVITEYPGKGRHKPNLRNEDARYIKGYDTDRRAFRQFKLANVQGDISWTREYAQDIT